MSTKKKSREYLLIKEPYKSLWINTILKAEDFEYAELIEKNSELALMDNGYVLMDKIQCHDDQGNVFEFLGFVK